MSPCLCVKFHDSIALFEFIWKLALNTAAKRIGKVQHVLVHHDCLGPVFRICATQKHCDVITIDLPLTVRCIELRLVTGFCGLHRWFK